MKKIIIFLILCITVSACNSETCYDDLRITTEDFIDNEKTTVASPLNNAEETTVETSNVPENYLSETYMVHYNGNTIKLLKNGDIYAGNGFVDKITDIYTGKTKYFYEYVRDKSTLGEDTGYHLRYSTLYSADDLSVLENDYCIYRFAIGNLIYKYQIDHMTNEGDYGIYDLNSHEYIHKNIYEVFRIGDNLYAIANTGINEQEICLLSTDGKTLSEIEMPFEWDYCRHFENHIVFSNYDTDKKVRYICNEKLEIVNEIENGDIIALSENIAMIRDNGICELYQLPEFEKVLSIKSENYVSMSEGFLSYKIDDGEQILYRIIDDKLSLIYQSENLIRYCCTSKDGSRIITEETPGNLIMKKIDGTKIAEYLVDYFDTGDGFIISTDKNYGLIDYDGNWIKKYE